jgi:hypothetical protein
VLPSPLENVRVELEAGHTTVVGAVPFLDLFGKARRPSVLYAEWNGVQLAINNQR